MRRRSALLTQKLPAWFVFYYGHSVSRVNHHCCSCRVELQIRLFHAFDGADKRRRCGEASGPHRNYTDGATFRAALVHRASDFFMRIQ